MASNILDGLFYKPMIYYIRIHNASVVVYNSKASSLYSIAVNSGTIAIVLWAYGILYVHANYICALMIWRQSQPFTLRHLYAGTNN